MEILHNVANRFNHHNRMKSPLTQKQLAARRKNGLANKTHGMTGTKVWRTWASMKNRCFNKKNMEYFRYGGRGISVDKRWLCFDKFYKDMGPPPQNTRYYSIDRIDTNRNYEPGNCRWATPKEQANNKTNNDLIAFNGKTKTLMEWSRHVGIGQDTLWVRLYRLNWPIEKALTKSTAKTHCPNGHKYEKADIVRKSGRRCAKCATAFWKRQYLKRKGKK